MIRYFCELKFKQERNLIIAVEAVKSCLCNDKDLPVRVEAALALQMLITEQEKGMVLVIILRWEYYAENGFPVIQ